MVNRHLHKNIKNLKSMSIWEGIKKDMKKIWKRYEKVKDFGWDMKKIRKKYEKDMNISIYRLKFRKDFFRHTTCQESQKIKPNLVYLNAPLLLAFKMIRFF